MKKIVITIVIVSLTVIGTVCMAYTEESCNEESANIGDTQHIVDTINMPKSGIDSILSGSSISSDDLQCNESILKTAYLEMKKSKFSSYSYGWVDTYNAEKPSFNDGVLCGKIKDFDNDESPELMTVRLLNSDKINDNYVEYAKVNIEMYEVVNNEVRLTSTTNSVALIDNMTDAGGLECFVKNNYIVLECASQNNTFADGATQYINVYSYDGNKFINEAEYCISGSIMNLDENNEFAVRFKELGFERISDYFNQEYISPYFIMYDLETLEWNFSECTNLATIEDNTEPLFELLITNNINNLLSENVMINDWNAYFVENGVMEIKTNNFSDLQ